MAREQSTKDGQHRLVVIAPMTQAQKDALVASWVLRLWWGVAEEKEFEKQGMFCPLHSFAR